MDENGLTRGGLTATKERPQLNLLGENGEIRALVAVVGDEPNLSLRDWSAEMRAVLGVSAEGTALTFCGRAKSVRGNPSLS